MPRSVESESTIEQPNLPRSRIAGNFTSRGRTYIDDSLPPQRAALRRRDPHGKAVCELRNLAYVADPAFPYEGRELDLIQIRLIT